MSELISIDVPSITRVEGEGALRLTIKDGKIEQLQLKIYEPPRYFEKFLQGRDYNEVIDVVARICGICPVAYQMSAVRAIETCFDLQVSDWAARLRQVLYCGEWIESHSLHIHLLALPDYYGYDSALAMAKDYPEIVTRGMRLQSLGNQLVALLGKRSIHPVGACVGGFYFSPKTEDVSALSAELLEGRELAYQLLDWLITIELPQHSQPLTCVALNDEKNYPVFGENIISNHGFSCHVSEFEQHFNEFQVDYSTALQCLHHDKAYLVGPLARLNLNHQLLPKSLLARVANLTLPSSNLFDSLLARAIEVTYCFERSIELLADYEPTTYPAEKVIAKSGIGYGATEAPRGLLWHKFNMDSQGKVVDCDIVPPTSQNQAHIEQDLTIALEQFGLDKPKEEIKLHAEMIIRNYDPCISCSTHFLDLTLHEI